MALDVDLLWHEEYDNLCTYFRKRLDGSDPNEAADLASAVFLRAWEKRRSYRPIPGVKPKSWLFHMAHNMLIDRYRRDGVVGFVRLGSRDPFGEEVGTDEHLDALDAQITVSKALETYQTGHPGVPPDRHLAVIREKYFVGGYDHEIGERLGLTEEVVKSVRHRALANLKKTLEEVA